MTRRSPIQIDHRERVATYLALLSSDTCRETLGRLIDPERLSFELCRLWFDEVYVPGISYFDGLKGDVSSQAVLRFNESFDDDELTAMERFHRFFELRVEMLRNQIRAAGHFPDTDLWRNLIKDAGYLLEDLDPHATSRKARLSENLAAQSSEDALYGLLPTGPSVLDQEK